jgi:hypothetical protein
VRCCVVFTRESRQVSRQSPRLGVKLQFPAHLKLFTWVNDRLTFVMTYATASTFEVADMSMYVLKYSSFVITVSRISFVMWPCLSGSSSTCETICRYKVAPVLISFVCKMWGAPSCGVETLWLRGNLDILGKLYTHM